MKHSVKWPQPSKAWTGFCEELREREQKEKADAESKEQAEQREREEWETVADPLTKFEAKIINFLLDSTEVFHCRNRIVVACGLSATTSVLGSLASGLFERAELAGDLATVKYCLPMRFTHPPPLISQLRELAKSKTISRLRTAAKAGINPRKLGDAVRDVFRGKFPATSRTEYKATISRLLDAGAIVRHGHGDRRRFKYYLPEFAPTITPADKPKQKEPRKKTSKSRKPTTQT